MPPPPADSPEPSLTFHDIVPLLQLMGVLGVEKREPRPRRLEFLSHMLSRLPATAGAAFVLKDVTPHVPPIVSGVVDVGFRAHSKQQVGFLQEFNYAPFQDLFSRAALTAFLSRRQATVTFRRSQLVADAEWESDPHLATYRSELGPHDVLLSLTGPANGAAGGPASEAYAIMMFRLGPSAEGFGEREATYLDAAHQGIGWIYREEAAQKSDLQEDLPRRLQQTLKLLLTGASERQIARTLGISQHTVHDYVKALYTRFSVSSRQELIAWWARRGLPLPQKSE